MNDIYRIYTMPIRRQLFRQSITLERFQTAKAAMASLDYYSWANEGEIAENIGDLAY